MRNLCLIVLAITLFGITLDCSTGVDALPEPNLLSNGSFEMNGQPSLAGWSKISSDSSAVVFSNDIPWGGGSNSVRLTNSWIWGGWIRQMIVALPDTHIYRLSAFGKLAPGYYLSYGRISLALYKSDTVLPLSDLYFYDTSWVYQSIIDTLMLVPGDSVMVDIRGDYHQMAAGYCFVDRVSFELIK